MLKVRPKTSCYKVKKTKKNYGYPFQNYWGKYMSFQWKKRKKHVFSHFEPDFGSLMKIKRSKSEHFYVPLYVFSTFCIYKKV